MTNCPKCNYPLTGGTCDNLCEQVPVIYAGCDTDGVVKLFRVKYGGLLAPLRLEHWLGILKAHRAQAGEMLLVDLSRDDEGPTNREAP